MIRALAPSERRAARLDRGGQFVDSDTPPPPVYSWFGPRRSVPNTASRSHPAWLAPSLVPVHLVCGPPAAGKSVFVAQRVSPAELVIDLDLIAAGLHGKPGNRGWDRTLWLQPALARRNCMLDNLSRPGPWQAAWFIVGEPQALARQWWRTQLGPGITYVLATPPAVCHARIDADQDRSAIRDRQRSVVADWWRRYRPAPGDTVIRPDAPLPV